MTKISALSRLALSAVLFSASLAAGCAPANQGAACCKDPERAQGLSVVGSGKVSVAPDLATIRFGVRESAPTATQASEAAGRKMQAVMAALKGVGIAENDIQTQRLSLHEDRSFRFQRMEAGTSKQASPEGPEKKVPQTRYVANHSFAVQVRDFTKIPQVLSTVQSSGVNEIDSVNFEVQDQKPVRKQARDLAIDDAIAQAKAIAARAGLALGPILSVSTTPSGGGHPGPIFGGAMRMMSKSDSAHAPVQPGQLDFQEQVYVRFDLAKARPAKATKR